jgi:cytidylate kinase
LQYHMVKRRENIVVVGPAGCGKSCLIQTLTVKYGVQYFGTADELREVPESVEFVVFDDFDFSDFSVDDMKRLLDREFDNQRVKVRYKDALLKRQMTRIILCNEVPKCLEDPAVQDR